MDMDMEIDMDIDMEIDMDMDLWMITRMLFKEAEAELGGADSCSQPVTFYIFVNIFKYILFISIYILFIFS